MLATNILSLNRFFYFFYLLKSGLANLFRNSDSVLQPKGKGGPSITIRRKLFLLDYLHKCSSIGVCLLAKYVSRGSTVRLTIISRAGSNDFFFIYIGNTFNFATPVKKTKSKFLLSERIVLVFEPENPRKIRHCINDFKFLHNDF